MTIIIRKNKIHKKNILTIIIRKNSIHKTCELGLYYSCVSGETQSSAERRKTLFRSPPTPTKKSGGWHTVWCYLKDAHPVFGVGGDVGGEGVATLQCLLGQEALPNILEDNMSKVWCFHDTNATGGRRAHHLERGHILLVTSFVWPAGGNKEAREYGERKLWGDRKTSLACIFSPLTHTHTSNLT